MRCDGGALGGGPGAPYAQGTSAAARTCVHRDPCPLHPPGPARHEVPRQYPALDTGDLHIATPHVPDRTSPLRPEAAAAEVCRRAAGGATEAEWHQYLPSVPYRGTCGT